MGTRGIVSVVGGDDGFRARVAELVASVGLQSACFASVNEFLDASDAVTPDCVVLGPERGSGQILRPLKRLARRAVRVPVISVTPEPDVRTVVRAMKLGCIDILGSPIDGEALLRSIAEALRRCTRDRREHAEHERTHAQLNCLTPREREVLELVVGGLANKAIAAHLRISVKTVEVHRGNVMRKMKADSLPQLVRQVMLGRVLEG
jgi:two-component system response regulator FixJ